MEQNLFKQAIAEAKTVREIAIANAKNSLAESFTPKIKSMFAAKLQENEELEENELEEYGNEHEMDLEDSFNDNPEGEDELELIDSVSEGEDEEIDLDELLAEMEADELSEDETLDENLDELEEAKDKEKAGDKDKKDDKKDKPKKDKKDDEDDESIADMSQEDLIALIKSIINGEEEGTEDAPEETEDEFSFEETPSPASTPQPVAMQEAVRTIKVLRKELQEVNLLNAKLLYVNKIFKAKTLTENEKVKVINTFDKATSLKEVKFAYNTLVENLKSKKATTIRESLGFASKSTNSPKLLKERKESDIIPNASILRMQQIAGIKPLYN